MMMKTNHLIATLSLALTAAWATPAMADSTPTHTSFVYVAPGSATGDDTTPWTGGFSDTPAAGSFLEEFYFNAPPVQMSYLWTQLNAVPGLTVSSVTLTYFGSSPDDPANVLATMGSTDASGKPITLSTDTYGNGTFAFWIAGTSDGMATLSGSINAGMTVAAVPEPSEWALMALGLGALPLLTRRRRKAL